MMGGRGRFKAVELPLGLSLFPSAYSLRNLNRQRQVPTMVESETQGLSLLPVVRGSMGLIKRLAEVRFSPNAPMDIQESTLCPGSSLDNPKSLPDKFLGYRRSSVPLRDSAFRSKVRRIFHIHGLGFHGRFTNRRDSQLFGNFRRRIQAGGTL